MNAPNLKLDSNDVVRVDAALQVGQISDSVTVEAQAVKVESDSSEISDLISGKQVEELAINGRHMAALAILTPGAASDLPDFNLPVSVGGSTNISFNGQRPEHNVWMIDGGENYDRGCGGCVTMMPAVSAIAEFNTITSNGASDIGIGSGGNINMAIKSGTRDFHGEVYEYFRNDAMDANNFFANKYGTPVPELRYNIYGWNLGGPVFIPNVYNEARKKTFFFWNQEWRKFVVGTQITAVAVPQAQRNGDFSGLSTPIMVPNTPKTPLRTPAFAHLGLTPGQPFPGNKIPASLIDPNARSSFPRAPCRCRMARITNIRLERCAHRRSRNTAAIRSLLLGQALASWATTFTTTQTNKWLRLSGAAIHIPPSEQTSKIPPGVASSISLNPSAPHF